MQAERLRRVGEELWLADGPPVSFYGFPYPTRMAVVRLRDGSLWVWSPIELDEALRHAVQAIGPVRFLISPNKLHHLHLGAWAQAFPDARLYASPGLARRRPDLHFHAELGDAPDPAWAADLDQVIFRGSFWLEEVVFFHRASRTALVCDLIQKNDPAGYRGWRRFLMRLDGLLGPEGSTPREWRASFWDRPAARAALRKALAWDTERLVIAHGSCALTGGGEALRSSLAWLRP